MPPIPCRRQCLAAGLEKGKPLDEGSSSGVPYRKILAMRAGRIG
ncbi:MAG: hypothetical protein ACTHMA_05935 [Thermomicrobiales bacterium]